ncbi:hypothetical protein K3T81_12915 [Oceanobacillus sp. GSFE11]|uniref:Uncharacterized protein n=1 Tax=Oceanobacillus jordanicus TaxID=2867266 RepID=A0AAW5B6B7_9BACI|nr:hypothetical protein [Oceanobacillus jordanicus]
MIDAIEQYWLKQNFQNDIDTLIMRTNGPENSSRRTQFMKRIIEFAARYAVSHTGLLSTLS